MQQLCILAVVNTNPRSPVLAEGLYGIGGDYDIDPLLVADPQLWIVDSGSIIV